MTLLITAVTATRNRADYLRHCLESVIIQAYPHKEHIVIDGGSTDGTVELLSAFSQKYPFIRWTSGPDRGPANAMNKGLVLAAGDAVGVIGDDDCYVPGAFEAMADAFTHNPGAGIVAGNCEFVRNDGTVWITQKASFTTRHDLLACWRYWGSRIALPAPAAFMSKQALQTIGVFDERDRYAMDYRHWIKITKRFPVATIDKLIARFRYDDGSISCSFQEKQWKETLAISREYWGMPISKEYCRLFCSYWWHYRLIPLRNAIRDKLQRLRGR